MNESLFHREREGPAAKRWEGEGLRPHPLKPLTPTPLLKGEGS